MLIHQTDVIELTCCRFSGGSMTEDISQIIPIRSTPGLKAVSIRNKSMWNGRETMTKHTV